MYQFELYLGANDVEGKSIGRYAIREFISTNVGSEFEAYTVIESVGVWRGTKEPCTIVRVITEYPQHSELLRGIARKYNKEFRQECCILTETLIGREFIF